MVRRKIGNPASEKARPRRPCKTNTRAVPLALKGDAHQGRVFLFPLRVSAPLREILLLTRPLRRDRPRQNQRR